MIDGIDHVLVSAPLGCEADARRFYGDTLGLPELPKPDELGGRGGCWFAAGTQQLHVGVEEPFTPARKAHPALAARDVEQVADALEAAGHAVRWDTALDGVDRFFVDDPFGNRLEIVQAARD